MSHLQPSSHAQAQLQHHNEILAQIAGSRGAQQPHNRQANWKGASGKHAKEPEALQDRLSKIVDMKLYA